VKKEVQHLNCLQTMALSFPATRTLVEFQELQVLCISDTLPMVVTGWFCRCS